MPHRLVAFALGLPLVFAIHRIHAAAFVITAWDFNSPDGNGTTGSLAPNFGQGSANALGNAVLDFALTSGSSDLGADNSALQITAPAGTAAGLTLGAEFRFPTLGYRDITVSFDCDHPAGSTSPVALNVSTDGGTTWQTPAQIPVSNDAEWTWQYRVDLGLDPATADAAGLIIQFLGHLDMPVNVDTPALQLDIFTVTGTPLAVPEPHAAALSTGMLLMASALLFGRGRAKA